MYTRIFISSCQASENWSSSRGEGHQGLSGILGFFMWTQLLSGKMLT